MSIENGYAAVSEALFGPKSQRCVGVCTRCRCDLILDPGSGNCQSNYTYQFRPKKDAPFGIMHGMCLFLFSWEADLCNQCIISLNEWLGNGKEEAGKRIEETRKETEQINRQNRVRQLESELEKLRKE